MLTNCERNKILTIIIIIIIVLFSIISIVKENLPYVLDWKAIIPSIVLIHIILLLSILYLLKNKKLNKKVGLSLVVYCCVLLLAIVIIKLTTLQNIKLIKSDKPNKKFDDPLIVTYNIANIPLYNVKSEEQFKALIKYLNQFDIVILQESFYNPFNKHDKNYLAKELSKEFNVLVSGGPNFFSFKWFDSGLIIASKFDISDYSFTAYKDSISIDELSQKGYLQCKLKDENGLELVVFNTHAQAGYYNLYPNDGFHESTRINQYRQLILDVETNTGPLVMAGDFNFRSETERIILRNAQSGRLFKYYIEYGVDGIYTTQNILSFNIEDPEYNGENPIGSDHYPLVFSIGIK